MRLIKSPPPSSYKAGLTSSPEAMILETAVDRYVEVVTT
jgi:hypothetical protein